MGGGRGRVLVRRSVGDKVGPSLTFTVAEPILPEPLVAVAGCIATQPATAAHVADPFAAVLLWEARWGGGVGREVTCSGGVWCGVWVRRGWLQHAGYGTLGALRTLGVTLGMPGGARRAVVIHCVALCRRCSPFVVASLKSPFPLRFPLRHSPT